MRNRTNRTDAARAETDPRDTGRTSTGPVDDRRDRTAVERPAPGYRDGTAEARDKFGGINWGAAFFGWLVAMAVSVLLVGIVGAVLAAVGANTRITQSDAQRSAGTIGIAAAITLLVILFIAYYAGGYVAGRMSRFDGARQGIATWVIGLLVTIIALALGALFGDQYNVLDRVNLPRLPVSTDELSWGGIITAVVVLVLTLVAAALGGIVGHRYHNRVDRAARV